MNKTYDIHIVNTHHTESHPTKQKDGSFTLSGIWGCLVH